MQYSKTFFNLVYPKVPNQYSESFSAESGCWWYWWYFNRWASVWRRLKCCFEKEMQNICHFIHSCSFFISFLRLGHWESSGDFLTSPLGIGFQVGIKNSRWLQITGLFNCCVRLCAGISPFRVWFSLEGSSISSLPVFRARTIIMKDYSLWWFWMTQHLVLMTHLLSTREQCLSPST